MGYRSSSEIKRLEMVIRSLEAEMFLDYALIKKRQIDLIDEINAALDSRDEKKFMELTNELKEVLKIEVYGKQECTGFGVENSCPGSDEGEGGITYTWGIAD